MSITNEQRNVQAETDTISSVALPPLKQHSTVLVNKGSIESKLETMETKSALNNLKEEGSKLPQKTSCFESPTFILCFALFHFALFYYACFAPWIIVSGLLRGRNVGFGIHRAQIMVLGYALVETNYDAVVYFSNALLLNQLRLAFAVLSHLVKQLKVHDDWIKGMKYVTILLQVLQGGSILLLIFILERDLYVYIFINELNLMERIQALSLEITRNGIAGLVCCFGTGFILQSILADFNTTQKTGN